MAPSIPPSASNRLATAEQAAGNDHFRAGRLEEALAVYLEGVRRAPGVRSVTHGG